MTVTQAPLEKQLVNIDLSKGMDERQRPELMSSLTAVHNLVQDQTGAWVKRNGLTALAYSITTERLLRLREGLACVTSDSTLRHYQEGLGAWLSKGTIPSLSVEKADLVASSGPNAFGYIYANASCTKYHAIVTQGGVSSVGGIALLTIFDRNSGATVGTYDLTAVCNAGDLLAFLAVKMVFVADRYLSIYMAPNATSATGTKLFGAVIDTGVTLPANSAAITATVLHTSAGLGSFVNCPRDVAAWTDRSIVSFSDSNNSYLLSMSTAGAFIEEAVVVASFIAIAGSGSLWYVSGASIGARNPAVLATVTVALGVTGAGGTVHAFGVDSSATAWLVVETNKTVGGSAVTSNAIWKASAPGGTAMALNSTIDGWNLVSHPFMGSDLKMYCHMSKDFLHSAAQSLMPHIVVNLTDKSSIYSAAITNNSLRIGCTLEPFVAASVNNGLGAPLTGGEGNMMCRYGSYLIDGGKEFNPVVAIQTVSRGYGFSVFTIKTSRYGGIVTKVFGGSNYISGGTHISYAGDKVAEADFVDIPIMAVTESVGAGAIAAGIYKYIAVYRCVDETGAVAYSRCSNPFSVTLAANKSGDMSVVPCAVTMRDPFGNAVPGSSPISIDVYRTLSGGTQYYLVASSQVGTPATGLATQLLVCAASRLWTFSDNLTDATVAAQPLLFRQPGTVNSPLDRYPPPGGKILCQHKDRLFTADPYGQRVYYSSFFVDGETAWYAPAFSFFVHGGTGPITAIGSMDGRLIVFKRDGIFIVDGDGPPEGGPNGSEYSPPQRIPTEYGCIDQNSLLLTTEGLVYRSTRGIELLDRNLRVSWVGDAVQDTVNDHTRTLGTCLDTFGRVHMLLCTNTAPTVGLVTAETGVEVIWDIPSKAWSVNKYTPTSGTYGKALQDVCIADIYGLGEIVCYADPSSGTYYGDATTFKDATSALASAYVPFTMETGWIRSGPQARQRVSDILLLAKKRSGANHALKISIAYNYVDSYTQTSTWQPSAINVLAIEELLMQPATQQVLAFRIKIEDLAPSATTIVTSTDASPIVLSVASHAFIAGDLVTVANHLTNTNANGNWVVGTVTSTTIQLLATTGTGGGAGSGGTITFNVGTGAGCDVLAITAEVAPKLGAPKLAAGQKA